MKKLNASVAIALAATLCWLVGPVTKTLENPASAQDHHWCC